MKVIALFAGGAIAALALAGCNPPHPHPKILKTIASLDCPETQGDLNRKSVAADGKSCEYATDGGDQVSLRLLSLDGKTAKDALVPIEDEVRAEAPAALAKPPTPPEPPEPGDGDSHKQDRVDIDLPGIHIHGVDGGHTHVDTPGVHVDSDDHKGHSGDHAVVQINGFGGKGVSVNANDGGAQIRVDEGNASGVKASYILASDTPGPHGFKTAGYEARGPKTGPIAVAVVLAKGSDEDDIRHDVRELLKHNVGG